MENIHKSTSESTKAKILFMLLNIVILFVVLFLYGMFFSRSNVLRMLIVLGFIMLYILRLAFTNFIIMKRKLSYVEVIGVSLWIALIEIIFALSAMTNPHSVGILDAMAIILYVFGLFIGTYAEYQRYKWKKLPTSQGRLYTKGLFKYSMHINYFGDVIWCWGFCLLGLGTLLNLTSLILPIVMVLSFIYYHIPTLNKDLAEQYSDDFPIYMATTKKLIPFIY